MNGVGKGSIVGVASKGAVRRAAQNGVTIMVGGNDVVGKGVGTVGVASRGVSSTVPNSKSKRKHIVTTMESGIDIMESKMRKMKLAWKR